MKQKSQHTPFWHNPTFLACLIIGTTTLVRYFFVATNQLDLVQDEAQYWDWTRHPQLSYYSKGPLIAAIIGTWTSVFGDTELGVRFGAVLHSCVAQLILYFGLAKLMHRPKTALWVLVAANTTPLFIASGLLMTTDSPLLVCWAGALFSLYWASLTPERRTPYVLLGACIALGILAKYMMLAFVPVIGIYLLGIGRSGLVREGLIRKLSWSVAVGVILGFLPILLWNMLNDFVGFRHVGALAGVAGNKAAPMIRFDRFPEFFASQVGMLTPWWFVFMLMGAWAALKSAFPKNTLQPDVTSEENQSVQDGKPFTPREAWLLVAGFWPLWVGFMLWSFHKKIYPNWPAMSYVAGLILTGYAFASWFEIMKNKPKSVVSGKWQKIKQTARRPWLYPALGLFLFTALMLQNWLPFPASINPTLRLKGWTSLGHKLEELRDTKFPHPEKVFFFADTYDITASLAFYAPGKPITYCAAFDDRRMSQYDLWPGPGLEPGNKLGWDAIYVDKRFKDNMPIGLEALFDRVTRIHYQSTHRGQPARKFTILLCHGFKGPWPTPKRKSF